MYSASTAPRALHRLHDKLPLLAALCLSTLMSVAIVAFRVHYSGAITYAFLVWNLFLAWVPLCSALALWYFSYYGRRTLLLR